jgi:arylsulfatase A-like enzyme
MIKINLKSRSGNMRAWIVVASLTLAVFILEGFRQSSNKVISLEQELNNRKPNILFIFTDDQEYQTIGALGEPEIFTPTLDSLAGSGTTFSYAFNMGSWQGAVCGASRTMLMTGLPLWAARQSEKRLDEMAATKSLWIQQLKNVGYETYMSGKWGLRTDVHAIFDHVINERTPPNQTPEVYNRPLSPQDTLWKPWDEKFGGFWKGGKHWSEVMADDAINYFQEIAKKDTPFFMYLAFHAPHDPRQAPKKFLDKYPLEKISMPASYLDEYPYKEQIGSGAHARDEMLAPFPRTPYAIKKQIQEYYAIISHMDAQMGKILHALATSGKSGNTYVFFTSDNGLSVGHHGLMGKQNMFDHSMRVPLIVTGPGIPKGEKRDQQVYLQDIMATTYDLAGIDKPAAAYYNSFLPLVKNKRSDGSYPEIYGAYMDLQRMVRTNRYKLIVYPTVPRILLFDLKKDPEEIQDVSGRAGYQAALADMKKRLVRQQKLVNDTLDLTEILKSASQ